jgi:hypothetical protein
MSDLPPYPGPENYRLLAEMNRIAASKAGPAKKTALERLAKEYEERADEAAEAIRAWRSSHRGLP